MANFPSDTGWSVTQMRGFACFVLLWSLAFPAMARPYFPPWSYYGAPSETHADRVFFGRLTRQFQNQRYSKVRRKLIDMGYRPVRLHHTPIDRDFMCPYSWRDEYPETIACSGTGLSGRAFVFLRPRSSKYAIVTTYGEMNISVNSIRAATKDDVKDIAKRQAHDGRGRSPSP